MAKKPHGKNRKSRKTPTARRNSPVQRHFIKRSLTWLVKWLAVSAVWGVIAAIGLTAWYAYDLPDVNKTLAQTRPPSVTIVAADGSELATIGDLYAMPVNLDMLPPALPRAVLATEDRRFYHHFGLDIIGLVRAGVSNIIAGRIVQGGSTITQQVAKNLFLTAERTIKRKAQELLLALWLEHKFTKDQILTVYLNRVYLGSGVYGVEAASHKYFAKSSRNLSTYQAAMIAGLLKAPSRYNPISNPQLAAKRTEQVLANMVAAKFLSRKQANNAKAHKGRNVSISGGRRYARYFADWIMEQVADYITPGDRDLVVITTLDSTLQRLAETKSRNMLDKAGKKSNVSETALLAMSTDGAIRAMVGGRNYRQSQFNRATQALRQPGSAFKPFVYLAGLESGLGPESRFIDAPLNIGNWRPKNFSRRYRGEVTMNEALSRSINTIAVKVAESVGRQQVIKTARRLGLTSRLTPNPSLALGTSEVSLIELTAAYTTFANGGYGVWPYGIEEIQDSHGKVLYRRSGSGPGRVISKINAATMNNMLGDVVKSGTGHAARLNRPAAGKTGTSQNFRDAWFIGYSAELVTGIWMGNDNNKPMRQVTGGGLPAKLWHGFMSAALKGIAPSQFPAPLSGMEQKNASSPTEKKFWNNFWG